MSALTQMVKSALGLAGLDLRRLSVDSNSYFALRKSFERFHIDMVFDIGANAGQFALGLRSVGYRGDIVSFEPLTVAHAALTVAAERDSRWRIHPRGALGNQNGEIEINIAGNSVSSSILPMMASHSDAATSSAYVGKEATRVQTVDSVADAYLKDETALFLKIDTQGFEWEVLDGAAQTLPRVRGLLCELSLTPLYENQRLWGDMIRRLENSGFTLWSLQPAFTDPRDGRVLQVDASFFRLN